MESELIKPSNMGIFRIFRESFKTIKRNRKLLLPVLFVVFLSFSQLEFAQTYLLEPVAKDFLVQLAEHPKLFEDLGNNIHKSDYTEALNDLSEILMVKFFYLILSSIISLVFLVATVSSSSEAYTAKVLDRKDLILKIKKSWKNPIFTSLYMVSIIMGSFLACSFSVGVVSIFAVDSLAYLFYGVLFLTILVLWFYVSALWMVSLIVSVLEDIGGLGAIVRAKQLIKGKRVQASKKMALFALSGGLIHLIKNSLVSNNLDKWSLLAVSIPFDNGLLCALRLLAFVVFTIFYHERKESYDEKEGKGIYVPIIADEV